MKVNPGLRAINGEAVLITEYMRYIYIASASKKNPLKVAMFYYFFFKYHSFKRAFHLLAAKFKPLSQYLAVTVVHIRYIHLRYSYTGKYRILHSRDPT